MRVDIVTPERQLVSTEADRVQIPGTEGEMTVMDHHAPTVTTLRPGIVTVSGDAYVVTGGFAEISESGTSILAEHAVPQAEASREMLEALRKDAEEAVDSAPDKIAARQRVNDIAELIRRIG
ncbi:ATP synthase F1 subunit epsilon [Rhodobacteraceae bacterium 2CG4]|uniref:ATP synthase epsilon chain n=1 Tax=Halovulum marinum TaxID=2662447 RepID=A0A6L5Z112_9RHOB|nr:ATP synthase F1 subunit epsilon [Halovulum marinum]MSU89654.1 ATP synthase F1 subunit epsilon [Halovulum marinum]